MKLETWGIMKLRRWSYEEERNGNHLLVWSNPPCWKIVDQEFINFLEKFTDDTNPEDIITHTCTNRSEQKQARDICRQLVQEKILNEGDFASENTTADQLLPIENIALNVTNHCNLRCIFCYNLEHLRQNPEGEISADEVIDFLKQVKPFCAKSPALTILGGEPVLAESKLLQIVKFAKKNKFQILISSNGTKVTKTFAKQARKLGLQVQISLDGHNAEQNDLIRGQGTFERIVTGIKTLVSNKVYTIISMVCHQGNLPYLEDYYQLALDLGVDEARFIPLKMMFKQPTRFPLKPVNLLELTKKSADLFSHHPEFRKLNGRDFLSITANSCRHSNPRISCGTGLQTFLLDADGSLYPCLNLNQPQLKFGNITDPNFVFSEIWHNSSLLKQVRKATNMQQTTAACQKCPVANWCLGGCHGETYVNSGSFEGQAVNCQELRQAIIETMWIFAEKPEIIRDEHNWIC